MNQLRVNLTDDEALVLFEWLARFEDVPAFDDHAEELVAWRLQAQLEKALTQPLRSDYQELLAEARRRVRDSE